MYERQAAFLPSNLQINDNFSLEITRYYDLDHNFTGYGAWRYGNRPLFVDDADPSNDIRPTMTGGRDYQANFEGLQPLRQRYSLCFQPSWTLKVQYAVTQLGQGYRPPGFNRAAAKEGKYSATANNVRDDGTSCGTDAAIDSNAGTGFPGYCLPYLNRTRCRT